MAVPKDAIGFTTWPRWLEALGKAIPAKAMEGPASYFPPPESQGGWRKLDGPDDIRRLGGMDPDKLAELRQCLLDSYDRNFAAVVIRRGFPPRKNRSPAASPCNTMGSAGWGLSRGPREPPGGGSPFSELSRALAVSTGFREMPPALTHFNRWGPEERSDGAGRAPDS